MTNYFGIEDYIMFNNAIRISAGLSPMSKEKVEKIYKRKNEVAKKVKEELGKLGKK